MKTDTLKPYIVLVVLFAAVLFIANSVKNGNFGYGIKKQNLQKEISNENSNNEWLKNFTVPENKKSDEKQTVSDNPGVPELNTVYLGKYNNTDAVFITDTTSQVSFTKEGVRKSSPYYGKILWDHRGSSVDFRDLVDFKKIYTFTKIGYLSSFLINDSRTVLYLSADFDVYTKSEPWKPYTEIYAVDLKDQIVRRIWTNISEKNEEGKHGSSTVAQSVGENYIVVHLGYCYACGGGSRGYSIVNTTTGKEKVVSLPYKKVGNIQFNLSANIFTYQAMKEIPDPCIAEKNCDGIPSSTYEPEGPIYTEKLP